MMGRLSSASKGSGRGCCAQVARGQHRQDGQQVGGDLLVVLAVVAEGAHLGVDHLVALVLGDVVLVVGDEGHQVGAGRLRRPFNVAAMGIVQQLLHLWQFAPADAEGLVVVAAQRVLQHRLDAALDVLGEFHQVRPFFDFDQALHHDVDGIPAEGRRRRAVSGGMMDWMREAISVGFCQLKVKSRRTPAPGRLGGIP